MDMGNAFEDPMLDGLEVVGSVCLENAAENTMVEGIDVVRLDDAVPTFNLFLKKRVHLRNCQSPAKLKPKPSWAKTL